MKAILYYSDKCPDTPPFVEALKAQNIDYDSVNIMASMKNLKEFLALRDQKEAFLPIKAAHQAGVPVLKLGEQFIFYLEELSDL